MALYFHACTSLHSLVLKTETAVPCQGGQKGYDMSGNDYDTFGCAKCNANHHLQTYTHKVKFVSDNNILRGH